MFYGVYYVCRKQEKNYPYGLDKAKLELLWNVGTVILGLGIFLLLLCFPLKLVTITVLAFAGAIVAGTVLSADSWISEFGHAFLGSVWSL